MRSSCFLAGNGGSVFGDGTAIVVAELIHLAGLYSPNQFPL